MTSHRLFAAPLIAALACVGCSSKTRAPPQPVSQEGMPSLLRSACPMEVPGTTVASEDVEEGASLVFKTNEGDVVEDLRTHARRMAEIHNLRGTLDDAPHSRGTNPKDPRESMLGVTSTASVEDIEGGSRIVFRPHDPSMLDTLRRHVMMRARSMIPGRCR